MEYFKCAAEGSLESIRLESVSFIDKRKECNPQSLPFVDLTDRESRFLDNSSMSYSTNINHSESNEPVIINRNIVQPTLPDQMIAEANNIAEDLVNKTVNQGEGLTLENCEKEGKTNTISNDLKADLSKIVSKMFEEKCKFEAEISSSHQHFQRNTDIPTFPEKIVIEVKSAENARAAVDEND